MNREYIMLNGQPFVFTSRTFSISGVGGDIERSITGKAHKDVVTTKCKWSFLLDGISGNDMYRLTKIFKSMQHIVLIDYDSLTYTVLWTSGELTGEESADNCFSTTISFEEE